jgi:anthranilate phosphoribosyltransferase
MITELRHGRQIEYSVSPASLGLPEFSVDEVSLYSVRDAERLRSPWLSANERASVRQRAEADFPAQTHEILEGRGRPAHEALIAANAAAGLYVGGRVDSLEAGTALALELLRSGAVGATARMFAETCQNPSRSRSVAALYPSRGVASLEVSS